VYSYSTSCVFRASSLGVSTPLHSRLVAVGRSRVRGSSVNSLSEADHLVASVSGRRVVTGTCWVAVPNSRPVTVTVTDHWRCAGHAVTYSTLFSVVLGPHVLSHNVVPVLPSLRVFVKGSSTGKVVSLTVLLLPLGKSAHVPLGGLARWPKIRYEGQEVEDEDESDGPFESGSDRSDPVTLRGRATFIGLGVTSALRLAICEFMQC
jgi:hypothetical protein